MAIQSDIIATVGVRLDESSASQLGRDVQSRLNKSFGRGPNGLGTINGDFLQFNKSLDAANSRVLAFGASAGLVLGITRAFSSLVRETVEVDKAFRDINVILNLSSKNLTAFGASLFDVARNTGQSFKSISEGAVELSRAGLGAEQTLKRLKDTSILTRLSGLELAESVSVINTALNSFTKSASDSSTIVSKLAAVDSQFSVSSKDLAESLKRVGSASEDAGVDINSLLGLVTSARQITSRDGPVIAQALNSVFSRVSRPQIIEDLRSLGVAIDNTQDGVAKLKALSTALDNASPAQAALIKNAAGGVRNLNILSAVLKDVNNQYGIYARATEIAANASNEAQLRNEELNKSFSTLINRTGVNIAELGSQIGKLTLGPSLEKILGELNTILESGISKDSGSLGQVLGSGILKGLGEALSGPGLLLLGAGLFSLISKLAIESSSAFKSILGLNEAAKQRANIEFDVNRILQAQPELIGQALASERGLLSVVREVNSALLNRSEIDLKAGLATALVSERVIARQGKEPNFANVNKNTSIPNFAIQNIQYNGAEAYFEEFHNGIRLSGLSVPPSLQGRGIGGDILKQIINKSESTKKPIHLTASADQGRQDDLNRFYERFGFKKFREDPLSGKPMYSRVPNFPNFSNLSTSISREISASGLSSSQIRVGSSSSLVSPNNPSGLGVYNLRDEPGGLNQGISRALKEGRNPKTYGVPPNFAIDPSSFEVGGIGQSQRLKNAIRSDLSNSYNDLSLLIVNGAKSAKEAAAEFKKLGENVELSSKDILKVSSSFRALEQQFKSTIPIIQSQSQKIGQTGGLYPSLSQNPKQLFSNIGGINNILGPQFARLLLEARGANQYGGTEIGPIDLRRHQYDRPIGPVQPLEPNGDYFRYLQTIERLKREEQENKRLLAFRQSYNKEYGLPNTPERRDAAIARRDRIFPTPFNKADNYLRSPSFQNKALFGSFLIPTLAGPIQEAIGDKTTTQRGIGQTVGSSANILSYGLLGSQFGGAYGAAGGLALGGALEIPRIIKSFTDTIPDLEREMEILGERINKVNDEFSNVIQSQEKLKAYSRGELKLSPQQYVETQNKLSSSINAIGLSSPKYGLQFTEAIQNGDLNEADRYIDKISKEDSQAKNKLALEVLTKEVSSSASPYKNALTDIFQYIPQSISARLGAGGLSKENTIKSNNELATQLFSNYKDKEGVENVIKGNLLTQTNAQGKNPIQVILDKIKRNPNDLDVLGLSESVNNINNDPNGSQGVSDFQKQFAEFIKSNGFSINTFPDLFSNTAPGDRSNIGNVLKRYLSAPKLRAFATVPDFNAKKKQREVNSLLRGYRQFTDNTDQQLFLSQLGGQNQINNIQNQSDLFSTLTQSQAGFGAARSSPFGGVSIQSNAAFNILRNQQFSGVNKLNIEKRERQTGLIGQLLSELEVPNKVGDLAGDEKPRIESFNRIKNQLLGTDAYGKTRNVGDVLKNDRSGFIDRAKSTLLNVDLLKEYPTTGGDQTNSKVLEQRRDAISKFLKDFNKTDLQSESDINNFLDKMANEFEIESDKAKRAREQITLAIRNSYSSILDNLDDVESVATDTEEEVKGLTGRSQNRARNFSNTSKVLKFGQRDYNNGQLSTSDYRNQFLIPAANADLEKNGTVSGKNLASLLGSGFQYNQRDFFGQLKDDAAGLGDEMRSQFSSAFQSFVNGSKNASDSLRQLGISLATNVLDKVSSLAFNTFAGAATNFGGSALKSLFSSNTQSNGGLISRYASGGMVYGGSGIRDDVPAMLGEGSYVLKKNAVNKYGKSFLNSINSGRGFANGGINLRLQNSFDYDNPTKPHSGSFNVSPFLSVIGQTDENNPQNALKFGREQDFYSYLKTYKNYKLALADFRQSQRNREYGAYLSAALQIGGSSLSSYNSSSNVNSSSYGSFTGTGAGTVSEGQLQAAEYAQNHGSFSRAMGGLIKRYANGGSVDNVLALLTGGEFVVNRNAVNRMGVGYFDKLNNGSISPARYATGGLVGTDINTVNPILQDKDNGQISASLLRLVKINEDMFNLQNGTKSKVSNQNSNIDNTTNNSTAISPQVSITINMAANGSTKETSESNGDANNTNAAAAKQFGVIMKNVALQTIIEQQRPGGSLSNTR